MMLGLFGRAGYGEILKQSKTFVIIGGTSGIGRALAGMLVERGDRVVVGGRSREKLETTLQALGPLASGDVVDTEDRESLKNFFSKLENISGLFTPGASYQTGDFKDGDLASSENLFKSKFWGQYWAVHAALGSFAKEASIVLMSGAASARPIGAPAYAACNSALEGLARGLAIELAPIRVNCLSPGTTDSELWRNRPEAFRNMAYELWRQKTVVGRPATVEEQAHATLFLLDNGNMTGSTLFCDGGYTLR